MIEEDRKTFKLTFKDQRRIINKEITLLDLVVEKQEEIERLNNIINELEKWLSKEYMSGNYEELYRIGIQDSYNKLQELKGSNNEKYK